MFIHLSTYMNEVWQTGRSQAKICSCVSLFLGDHAGIYLPGVCSFSSTYELPALPSLVQDDIYTSFGQSLELSFVYEFPMHTC